MQPWYETEEYCKQGEKKQTRYIFADIGKIDNSPFYFIRVPKSKEPRVQPFTGYLLTDELEDDFLSILSWDVSLANFDNR
jgi:hypothetical protein